MGNLAFKLPSANDLNVSSFPRPARSISVVAFIPYRFWKEISSTLDIRLPRRIIDGGRPVGIDIRRTIRPMNMTIGVIEVTTFGRELRSSILSRQVTHWPWEISMMMKIKVRGN